MLDDHEPTRSALAALLQEAFSGCALLLADTAERAIEICESHAPTLVVMDIGLPGMDGLEATRLIKARWPATLVVMHSTSDEDVYRNYARVVGASAFVGKGRTASELVATIARLLPRSGDAES